MTTELPWLHTSVVALLNTGVDKSAIPTLGEDSNKNHMDTLLRALSNNPRFSFNIEKAREALRAANLGNKDLIPRGLTADVICAGMGIDSRSCTPRALERRGITVGRSPITDSCSEDDQLANGRCFDSTSGMTNDQLVAFASRLISEFGSGGEGNGGDGGSTTTTTTTTTTTPVETTQTQCPAGQTGTPPNCVDDTTPADTTPETCPEGQTGTPPNCEDPAPAETAPWQVENLRLNCIIHEGSLRLNINWERPDGVSRYEAQIHTGDPVADAQRFTFLAADRKVAWNTHVYSFRRNTRFPHPQRWPSTYNSLAHDKKYTVRIRPVSSSERGDWNTATAECPPKPPRVFLYVRDDDKEISEDDAGSFRKVTVNLSKTWNSAVSVTVATGHDDDTATEGSDYTLDYRENEARTVTIPAGERLKHVPLIIINDETDESNETFTVTISEPSNNATLGTASVKVTIIDNDEPEADDNNAQQQTGDGTPIYR